MKHAGRVMTVLGPVDPETLGLTLPHEHLLIDLFSAPARWDVNGVLQDVDLACRELEYLKAVGGGALVDASVPGSGRDPEGLRQIAERTGLRIIMGCGWYRLPYYPAEDVIDRRSVLELADSLTREIEEGYADTGIRPGIIGEIGCDKSWMSALEERVHRAVARAQVRTGLAITTHSIASPIGLRQLGVFEEEGVDPSRVVIGHADSYPVLDYHLSILERGANIQFDKVGNEQAFFLREADLVARIVELAHRGFLDRILLSQDICFRSELKAFGGRGYADIPGRFIGVLRSAGFSEDEVRTILVRNPQRILQVT